MISIIIPVIREDKFKLCFASIVEADKQFHHGKNVYGNRIEIVYEHDKARIGCPLMVKRLVEKSKGDQIMFLGDDTVMQEGCIEEAIKAMAMLPDGWGMVGLNDGRKIRTESAHFLIDKRMLPLIGGELFHTGYKHCFCDSELSLRARLLGRYCYAERANIYHDHPALHKDVESDETYDFVYSQKVWEHDELLFRQRKTEIIAAHGNK